MRILGIDPGSRVTGYGVIESNGIKSRHLTSGYVRTRSKHFPDRLGEIFKGLQDILLETQPDHVAVEQVFVSHNPSAALKLGQARGAAITVAVMADLAVYEYTPREIKQALVGSGSAEKEQVQHMVKLLLGIQHKLSLDESDALAVAVCHAHSITTKHSLQGFK